MYERARVRWSSCLVLALLATPMVGRAQDARPADRAALIERIQQLDSEVLEAQARSVRSDERAAEQQRGEKQDTVAVGPLHIITTHSQGDEARRLWSQAWSDVAPTLGARVEEVESSTSGPVRRFW